MPKIEKERLYNYLFNPDHCPFCSSPNITGYEITVEDARAYQQITCDACERSWTDEYQLIGVVIEEEDEEGEIEHYEQFK